MSPLAYAILATIQKQGLCILVLTKGRISGFDTEAAESHGVNLDELMIFELSEADEIENLVVQAKKGRVTIAQHFGIAPEGKELSVINAPDIFKYFEVEEVCAQHDAPYIDLSGLTP